MAGNARQAGDEPPRYSIVLNFPNINMENTGNPYDWCYLSGRINVLERYLLNAIFFERLLACRDFNDVLAGLNATPLKTRFTHVKHLYEYETLLHDYYYSRLREIRALSPDTAVCDFFLVKNEVAGLKQRIKDDVFGNGAAKSLDEYVRADAWQGAAAVFPEALNESVSCVRNTATRRSKHQQAFIIDLIFDGAYLRYVDNLSQKTEGAIIRRYLKTYHLIKGIAAIRRAVAMGIDRELFRRYVLRGLDEGHVFCKLAACKAWPSEKAMSDMMSAKSAGKPFHFSRQSEEDSPFPLTETEPGETGTFPDGSLMRTLPGLFQQNSFVYEVAADNYLLDMLHPVKRTPFGPERVFGYLCGLTTEVFNLKLALGGKMHRIGDGVLRGRLRKTYV